MANTSEHTRTQANTSAHTVVVTIRVPAALLAKLDAVAKASDRSRAYVIAKTLADAFPETVPAKVSARPATAPPPQLAPVVVAEVYDRTQPGAPQPFRPATKTTTPADLPTVGSKCPHGWMSRFQCPTCSPPA